MVHSVLQETALEPGHRSTKLTYADYQMLPDDGLRHEIIDGEHYVTPSPATRHQRISLRLCHLIQSYLDTHSAGELLAAPFDVVLSNHDVVEPDLLFLSTARAAQLTPQNLQGAPDLIGEILSPASRHRDERLKRGLYEAAGVDEYWIFDPNTDSAIVYRRGASGFQMGIRLSRSDVLTTSLLPGLELPLERVFA
jgi:Uma2 family endonuclease